MAKRIPALINPEILQWARETAGYTVEDIAAWLDKEPEEVHGWESGDRPLFMGQLRQLANRYKRPLSDFYLVARPAEKPIPHDFRRLPGEVAGRYSPNLRKQLRFARERQETAEYLFEQAGEEVPRFRHRRKTGESAEAMGTRMRSLLGVTLAEQHSWPDAYTALRAWRSKIENQAVLVFKFENVDVAEVAGFSIQDSNLPVIGINAKLKPNGQIFTLLHESMHLMLGEGSTCDVDDYTTRGAEELQTEMFCNAAAAAALMPQHTFLAHPTVAALSASPNWDEAAIVEVANAFRVSREAIVRRLLTFDRTTQEFYRAKRKEYNNQYQQMRERQKEKNKDQEFRRSPVQRAVSNLGPQYIRLVLDSYDDQRITLADAAQLLGVGAPYVRQIQEKTAGV
jgi:Zn-dependent peptidase ImmA (M78 family)